MPVVTLARHLMGTRFELVLTDERDPAQLRAAGEEALDEIERLEQQLSLYRRSSELSGVNARAALGWVPVDPRFFHLVRRALALAEATAGAFDPTITPLLRAWGFIGASGKLPSEEDIAAAREQVGWQHVQLDPGSYAVRFAREGMALDLGAIGKGYAVDQAVELLREGGIRNGLIHAGTSTVAALGAPQGCSAWSIAIANPGDSAVPGTAVTGSAGLEPTAGIPAKAETGLRPGHVALVALQDGQALSVSGVHGKCFTAPGGMVYGHILDPGIGRPVQGARLATVAGVSATDTDALSTALLVLKGDRPIGGPQGSDPHAIFLQDSIWHGLSALVIDAAGERMAWGQAFG